MAPKSEKEPELAREETSESESSSSAESNRKAEESSSSSSDGEQSDSSASESDNETSKSQKGQSGQKLSQQRSVRAPQQYKPPLGFKSVKTQSHSSNASSALSPLSGKQVFHITAPAFLPLSKVKEVSLAGALKGEPIMEHNGVQFGIPGDALKQTNTSGQTLFVYNSKAQTYLSTVTNVPTYHIREMIDIPGGAEYEETTLKAAKALEKPPRKQPKHLKMRFRPVGSGDGPPETLGSSSEESEEEEPTFKMPQGLEKEKERKRKHQQTEGDGSQAAGLPRKKSKKRSSDNIEGGEEKPKKSKDRDGKKRKKEKT